jgi:putative toxin-antitoxin system antitoxin component (TIGR02293 family)
MRYNAIWQKEELQMVLANEINAVLGGSKVIRRKLDSDFDYVDMIRVGLPIAALAAIAKSLDLPEDQILTALRIPKRTAARRKATNERLRPVETERLLRLARAMATATDVLGDRKEAAGWLQRPHPVLGDLSPISLLDTDIGLQKVLDILSRIEYGVYS